MDFFSFTFQILVQLGTKKAWTSSIQAQFFKNIIKTILTVLFISAMLNKQLRKQQRLKDSSIVR